MITIIIVILINNEVITNFKILAVDNNEDMYNGNAIIMKICIMAILL